LALFAGSGGALAKAQGGQVSKPPQTAAQPATPTSGQRSSGPPEGQRPLGPPPEYKWWQDEAAKKELALTEQQAGRIDRIYDRRTKDIDPTVQEWLKQREELNRMTRERVVDVQTYQLQAARTDGLYSRIHESRTVMLYSLYKELTPDQYKKLQAIFDRNRGRRGGGGLRH
jgi:Spy/CpxP family protein refolding chaperone